MRGSSLYFIALLAGACSSHNDPAPAESQTGSGSAAPRKPRSEQVAPPVSLQPPPADAIKTASGLIYKKLTASDAGPQPKRNDTVLINYTGWRQGSGETFFTNRGRGKPMPLNLSTTAPGFTEGLQLLHKGETAMLWMPPEIGYKSPPASGKAETLVYEVEVVDIQPAPAIPEDVAKAPDKAESLPTAGKRITVKPGTGKDKIRPYDTVTFTYTAWDTSGQMLDSLELRKHTTNSQPYKQAPAMTEMLTSMVNGERARFWVDASKMVLAGTKALPVTTGTLCYEVEVSSWTKAAHEPPPVPSDVAKPPADTKKTAKGVSYKMVKAGPGKDPRHPVATDTVRVNYTGWTTDGKMFDSADMRGEPATFNLGGVIAGWTDGIPMMTIGDRMRFWIPEELAYKGQPGKPQGMLVFDVELLSITPPPTPPPGAPPTPAHRMIPDDVIAAWGWEGADISELPGGLINATSAIRIAGAPIAVLQRLHPAFAGEVNLDIEAVTAHLAGHGLATPHVIRTRDGRAWHEDRDGRSWRALTWIDGETVHDIPDRSWAEAGGALVGRFHRAVADLRHDYVFTRAGVHDTPAHLARLRAHLDDGGESEALALGHQIFDAATGLPEMPDVPRRHCHGDLKISNLLFTGRPVRGVCLVDLDTIGLSTMAFEIGDAMRSWCNPFKEDVGRVRFDLEPFEAAIHGFRDVADSIVTRDERRSIVIGLETVCVELAARFAVDLFRDDYFGWDPARFPSRRAHNLVRAHGQLALALAVRAARADALEIVLRGS